MEHAVNVNGRNYSIIGGLINIGGWDYEVNQGITNINGWTGEILFKDPVTSTSIYCRTYDIQYQPDDPLAITTSVVVRSDTEGRQTITGTGDWSTIGNTVTLDIDVAKCNGDSWIRIFGDTVAEETKGSVSYSGVDITGQSIMIEIVATYSASYVIVTSDPLSPG